MLMIRIRCTWCILPLNVTAIIHFIIIWARQGFMKRWNCNRAIYITRKINKTTCAFCNPASSFVENREKFTDRSSKYSKISRRDCVTQRACMARAHGRNSVPLYELQHSIMKNIMNRLRICTYMHLFMWAYLENL